MKHLMAADRGKIEAYLDEHYTQKQIAIRVGVSKSCISREIARGLDGRGQYSAFVAQCNYESKRKRSRQTPILDNPVNYRLRNYLVAKLQSGWDPSQIAGTLKALEQQGRLLSELGFKVRVCAETIYEWIYTSAWAVKEKLYQYLRLGRKRRKKQLGRKVHRSGIPNRVPIHVRPAIVDEKIKGIPARFGDWEGDSVLFLHKRAINTLNERLTGFICLTKLAAKTAELTTLAVIDKLQNRIVHTLTFDNGSEFTRHEEIANQVGCQTYFADPYSSFQRGANENLNRQLRAYLPKRSSIEDLTQEELEDIANELNNKPRKRLGWRTPRECFEWCCNHPKEPLQLELVAFGSRI